MRGSPSSVGARAVRAGMASISAGIPLLVAASKEPWVIAAVRKGSFSRKGGGGAAAAEIEASPEVAAAAAAGFLPRLLSRSDKSVNKGSQIGYLVIW